MLTRGVNRAMIVSMGSMTPIDMDPFMTGVTRKLQMAFISQKQGARKRGILWALTFDEWLTLWEESGHLEEKGPCRGQYVMARIGDIGPYSKSNVEIITTTQNLQDAYTNQRISGLSRTRKSEPYIQQKVNLPATLAARFAQLHWDPVLQKTRYGALSQVMTKLVADYVNKVESGTIPAEDIKIEAL